MDKFFVKSEGQTNGKSNIIDEKPQKYVSNKKWFSKVKMGKREKVRPMDIFP